MVKIAKLSPDDFFKRPKLIHDLITFNIHRHKMAFCTMLPVPTELDIDSSDFCYLFRAVSQGNSDFAIKWMEKWKNDCPKLKEHIANVLWTCVCGNDEKVIEYLLANHLITQAMLVHSRNELERLNSRFPPQKS